MLIVFRRPKYRGTLEILFSLHFSNTVWMCMHVMNAGSLIEHNNRDNRYVSPTIADEIHERYGRQKPRSFSRGRREADI